MKNKEIKAKLDLAAAALARGDTETHFKIYCELARKLHHSSGTYAREIRATYKKLNAEKLSIAVNYAVNVINAFTKASQTQSNSAAPASAELKDRADSADSKERSESSASTSNATVPAFAIEMPRDKKTARAIQSKLEDKGIEILRTPFQILATHNPTTLLTYMLLSRHKINAVDKDGFAPIHHLCTTYKDLNSFITSFRILVQYGADIHVGDKAGRTILHLMLQIAKDQPLEEMETIIAYLLSQGLDPNALTTSGSTTLASAAKSGKPSLVQLLNEAGASVDFKGVKNALFDWFAFNKDIAALNCLMQGDAAFAVHFELPQDLLSQLDAGNGIVIGFINGISAEDLKQHPDHKIDGFRSAITDLREVIALYTDGNLEKSTFETIIRKNILFTFPDADSQLIAEKLKEVMIEVDMAIRMKQLPAKLANIKSSQNPSGTEDLIAVATEAVADYQEMTARQKRENWVSEEGSNANGLTLSFASNRSAAAGSLSGVAAAVPKPEGKRAEGKRTSNNA